jgi:hypothetical protein
MAGEDLRDRLLDLVRRIRVFDGGPAEHDRLIDEFDRLAPHPEATTFIFYDDLPDAEIVERVMAYKPIELPGPPPPADG